MLGPGAGRGGLCCVLLAVGVGVNFGDGGCLM